MGRDPSSPMEKHCNSEAKEQRENILLNLPFKSVPVCQQSMWAERPRLCRIKDAFSSGCVHASRDSHTHQSENILFTNFLQGFDLQILYILRQKAISLILLHETRCSHRSKLYPRGTNIFGR